MLQCQQTQGCPVTKKELCAVQGVYRVFSVGVYRVFCVSVYKVVYTVYVSCSVLCPHTGVSTRAATQGDPIIPGKLSHRNTKQWSCTSPVNSRYYFNVSINCVEYIFKMTEFPGRQSLYNMCTRLGCHRHHCRQGGKH